MRTLVLSVHVVAGTAGLLLGPLLLLAGRAHGVLRIAPAAAGMAVAYQVAVAGLTLTALGLVAFDVGRLWWLAPIAAATEAMALGGRRAGQRAQRGWAIRLLGGSYVALVTALLVVSWFSWISWLLPTALMVPVIEILAFRAERNASHSPKLAVTG
jgi:hypothetical protein